MPASKQGNLSYKDKLKYIDLDFRDGALCRANALHLLGEEFIKLPLSERRSIKTLLDVLEIAASIAPNARLNPYETNQINRILNQASRRRLIKSATVEQLIAIMRFLVVLSYWPPTIFAGDWLRSMEEKLYLASGVELHEIVSLTLAGALLKRAMSESTISFLNRWLKRTEVLARTNDPAIAKLRPLASKLLTSDRKLDSILPEQLKSKIREFGASLATP